MSDGLKLIARDASDLEVIASMLQDAVIPVKEMAFLPVENRFVFVADRFRWEDAPAKPQTGQIYERVLSGVSFEGVEAAKVRGLDQRRNGQILSLLTIRAEEGAIQLVFSAGVEIRLEVGEWVCHLGDLDEPWPTRWRPAHPLDEG